LVIWQCVRVERAGTLRRLVRAVTQPVVLGFLAGTIAFWVYGLAINVEEFWADHVRIHAYDRLIQYNPLDYQGYPTVLGLWRELWEHTGYVLMPLGVVALGMLCGTDRTTVGWRGTPGLWGVWMLVTAVTFSLIDWRQTKHLMPLLLPLHLAPACWVGACGEASRRTVLLVVSVLFAGLLIWNLDTLAMVADNFSRIEKHEFAPFRITPAW